MPPPVSTPTDPTPQALAAAGQGPAPAASAAAVAPAPPVTAQAGREASFIGQWDALIQVLAAALQDAGPRTDWLSRVIRSHRRIHDLDVRNLDGSLYYLIFLSGQPQVNYSALHGMAVCVICHAVARVLGWPKDWIQAVGLAALTMNASMTDLQNELAAADVQPTPEMKEEIQEHPVKTLGLLQVCGVEDPLWSGAVRWHHAHHQDHLPIEELSPPSQLARLLKRVDLFTARLSRRRNRAPMSPLQAARRACIGPSGQLDEIGSALLKAVGLYPPGTFVELASREIGIVVARGVRADLPQVVCPRWTDASALQAAARRDTGNSAYRVTRSIPAVTINAGLDHDRLLSLS